MAKKDKVSILHTDDFEEVDAALTEAMASLDQINERISTLLESETHDALSEAAERKIAGGAPEEAEEEEEEASGPDAG